MNRRRSCVYILASRRNGTLYLGVTSDLVKTSWKIYTRSEVMPVPWNKLQPLRVASGWVVDINNFYEIDPSASTMNWFVGSVLISGHHEKTGLCFDARYEPEGDLRGCFVIDFMVLECKEKRRAAKFLGTRETKERSSLVKYIEEFMFVEKLPSE